MRPAGPDPDAFLYRSDGERLPTWLCVRCMTVRTANDTDTFQAWCRLVDHLRYAHGLLSVYVEREQPGYDAEVQLGLPFAIALNTRRT